MPSGSNVVIEAGDVTATGDVNAGVTLDGLGARTGGVTLDSTGVSATGNVSATGKLQSGLPSGSNVVIEAGHVTATGDVTCGGLIKAKGAVNPTIITSASGGYLQASDPGYAFDNTISNDMSQKYSIHATNNIVSDTYIIAVSGLTFSDKRIKSNIVDVPDNVALDQVRDIPCRHYEYKDKVNRGTEKTIGYIAQEVEDVLPMAVKQITKVIPNEYHVMENVVWEEIEDETGNTKYKLKVSASDFTDLNYQKDGETNISGVKYEFYVSNDDLSNIDWENVDIKTLNLSEEKIEVTGNEDNESFTFEKKYENVFMYGREVDDFLTVDKAKICALHHASIQEIDRLQEANTEKIRVLEEENQSLRSEVDTLKAELQTIKTHLNL